MGVDALSRREHEVAMLTARGATATEIASHLSLSKRTVESHLVSIYEKLGRRLEERADPPGGASSASSRKSRICTEVSPLPAAYVSSTAG